MSALEKLAALIRRECGIAIKPAQFPMLESAMTRAAPGVDPERLLAVARDPGDGRRTLERLIDEVAVKETYFFRHERELLSINWRMLWGGARAAGRDVVRVWSAACATGEEPYTLAMLACEAFGSSSPPVSILGTDISPTALEQAQRAQYGRRAAEVVTDERRARWFQAAGSGSIVDAAVRRIVRFRRHNLARESMPPTGEARFDVIVCRNVLIYFDRPTVERTISSLEDALHPDGLLVIGASDRLAGPLTRSAPARRLNSGPSASAGAVRQIAGRRATLHRTRANRSPQLQQAPSDNKSTSSDPLEDARRAVRDWSLEETVTGLTAVLERDPLNVDAYFVRGVAQLASQDPASAVASLRRALYLDPEFGLAAFKLARAHEELGDTAAARRAYHHALHSLRPDDPRNTALLGQVDVANVASACSTRLAELDREAPGVTPPLRSSSLS